STTNSPNVSRVLSNEFGGTSVYKLGEALQKSNANLQKCTQALRDAIQQQKAFQNYHKSYVSILKRMRRKDQIRLRAQISALSKENRYVIIWKRFYKVVRYRRK